MLNFCCGVHGAWPLKLYINRYFCTAMLCIFVLCLFRYLEYSTFVIVISHFHFTSIALIELLPMFV